MLTDRERLARQRARPLLVELYNALSRLTSVLTVMNTGAHPDDEQSGLLAVLRYDLGMRVVIACSTRGEGGQNSVGPERGGLLGVVRTRELEEAARVLGADIAWLGFGPDDPVHDFGFSKNGVDTLARWGRERLLERLVRAYRRERPDIVIPTFLDVPGQHGHHRAMTEAATAAVALAADPTAYPEHLGEGLQPWRVTKFYLPAWSGGGGTYDDELPPPNATVAVRANRRDPATGAEFADIGQWSRAFHATQGMGEWTALAERSWSLHLTGDGAETEADIRDHLPASLAALGTELGGPAGAAVAAADVALRQAIAGFPHGDAIVAALGEAARQLATGVAALGPAQAARHGHRLQRKQAEIGAAMLLATGVAATAWLEPATVAPGGTTTLCVQVVAPPGRTPRLAPRLPAHVVAGPAVTEAGVTRIPLRVAADAPLSTPFTAGFASLGGNGEVGVTISAEIAGATFRAEQDLDEMLAVVPAHSVTLDPDAVVVPLGELPRTMAVAVSLAGPPAAVTVAEQAGIATRRTAGGVELALTPELRPGRHRLEVRVDGAPAHEIRAISHRHIGRSRLVVPQLLDVLALELALPRATRVGYVGGGSDRVGLWLRRMGLDVTDLDAAALGGALAEFTTIVVGIFGFGLRADLAAAVPRLHDWVAAGGHLVTLYHRPSDGWDPDRTPPRRLVIGSPSLRWRVTDRRAEVRMLQPEHPLLRRPNVIGPADWAGWDKERGLYFASDWDPAYAALLAMHDGTEAPLEGALLSAGIGAGRHTHTSLVLHHQLDALVPGAFRLLANLVQPAGGSA